MKERKEKFDQFKKYCKDAGFKVEDKWSMKYQLAQFLLLEDGVRDGRICDQCLVAYSRLEVEKVGGELE